jgi:hypothetical protein
MESCRKDSYGYGLKYTNHTESIHRQWKKQNEVEQKLQLQDKTEDTGWR